MESVRILIIEDEAIVAQDLAARLESAGYAVAAVVDNGEEAVAKCLHIEPDLVMADIHLKGKMDGIQTVERINQTNAVPVIYLTAYADAQMWERAKQTRPSAYLTKPFRERDIHSAIELAVTRHREKRDGPALHAPKPIDHFFIRIENGRFEKLALEDLLYLEADRSYCHVYTRQQRVTLSEPLNKLQERISHENLVRIHRSYVINTVAVEAIDHNTVIINGIVLPIGQSYEADFFSKIQFIR
ncbi:response regulator [Parapedobacter sp. DT-150]|uniref:response regulator n=1 Tax=Parapedobacter sp. DT-150 TaxID=3396162 RepID=UPI003F1B133A